jgi:hypothetical protein
MKPTTAARIIHNAYNKDSWIEALYGRNVLVAINTLLNGHLKDYKTYSIMIQRLDNNDVPISDIYRKINIPPEVIVDKSDDFTDWKSVSGISYLCYIQDRWNSYYRLMYLKKFLESHTMDEAKVRFDLYHSSDCPDNTGNTTSDTKIQSFDDMYVDWNDLTTLQQNKVKLILPKRKIDLIGYKSGFTEFRNGIWVHTRKTAHERSPYNFYHKSSDRTHLNKSSWVLSDRYEWIVSSTSRYVKK